MAGTTSSLSRVDKDEGGAVGAARGSKSTKIQRHPFSKKQAALLHALCHIDGKQRAAVLRSADDKLVKSICECALNVLHGVVQLKDSEKNRLKKHKKILRRLADSRSRSKNKWRLKKRDIIQSGGSFVPLLLAPLISTVFEKILLSKSNANN